jgi:DNA repair protein RadB
MIENVPLGCVSLDRLLGSGIKTRTITQVYGEFGTGKSNICLQAVVRCIGMGKKVVYIDPEGSFSEKRVEQIARESKQKVLDNTYLVEVSDFEEQCKAVDELPEKIDEDVLLIVVDSIAYLYRLAIGEEKDYRKVNQALGLQLARLLDIARKRNVAVLITNQVYTDQKTGEKEPVGGDILKYASKIIVRLDKIDAERRKATLVKHQHRKAGESAGFRIVGAGVV